MLYYLKNCSLYRIIMALILIYEFKQLKWNIWGKDFNYLFHLEDDGGQYITVRIFEKG